MRKTTQSKQANSQSKQIVPTTFVVDDYIRSTIPRSIVGKMKKKIDKFDFR